MEGRDAVSTTARRRHGRPRAVSDGVDGNEQLTALTGTVLLVGFPARPGHGGTRLLLVGVSLGGGLVLALLAMRLATGWTAWAPRW